MYISPRSLTLDLSSLPLHFDPNPLSSHSLLHKHSMDPPLPISATGLPSLLHHWTGHRSPPSPSHWTPPLSSLTSDFPLSSLTLDPLFSPSLLPPLSPFTLEPPLSDLLLNWTPLLPTHRNPPLSSTLLLELVPLSPLTYWNLSLSPSALAAPLSLTLDSPLPHTNLCPLSFHPRTLLFVLFIYSVTSLSPSLLDPPSLLPSHSLDPPSPSHYPGPPSFSLTHGYAPLSTDLLGPLFLSRTTGRPSLPSHRAPSFLSEHSDLSLSSQRRSVGALSTGASW
uniref:Uncharacterized protein n=1 Tax=Knipowitschia caucasica TaxID=637954 RepID=A0AAV2KZ10_KNICA